MTLALFRNIITTNITGLNVAPLYMGKDLDPPALLYTRADYQDYPALSGADELNTILINTYLCTEGYADNENYGNQLRNLLNCLQSTYVLSGVSYFVNSIYLKNWVDLTTSPYRGHADKKAWSRQSWRVTWRNLSG